jgi:hypothetical protein
MTAIRNDIGIPRGEAHPDIGRSYTNRRDSGQSVSAEILVVGTVAHM